MTSGQLRSKHGCWTCRLRKKKCDERHPYCSTCDSLGITCYGFGPKPDWFNDPEKEKAILNGLKGIVKRTSRRKAATQFSVQATTSAPLAPKHTNGFAAISTSSPGSDGRANVGSLQNAEVHKSEAGLIFPSSANDSVLFMHYLDCVFSLQYPMYKPTILDGGRGWLLSLLLRTKPLYHAALALSAYHRRTNMLALIPGPSRAATLVQQEQHLEACIVLVNQAAQKSCPRNGLDIAFTVAQLVFYELFTGSKTAWIAHLHAARSMYHRGYQKDFAHFGLDEETRCILRKDRHFLGNDQLVAEEVVTFRFLRSVLVWLDIIFSVTTGTAPQLPPDHFCVIASNSQTKLQNIMGCQNSVMLLIGRIAALNASKVEAVQQRECDLAEFDRNVDDVGREIQCDRNAEALQRLDMSKEDPVGTLGKISDSTSIITFIFANMASIYLHLVVHGFQKLFIIETTISEAMRRLSHQETRHLLPALVCPLYIIGCVARPEDERFFRNIFSTPPLLDAVLQHRQRILPILEEIWDKRRSGDGFSWQDVTELTQHILLI